MKPRPILIAAAISCLIAAPALLAAESKGVKSYKWVDKNGVTHYGDMVPPEYATQGRSELNAQGVEMRQYPRQLSPAEADVAQQQAATESRRRQHDSFLLTTYTRASDIEQLRDERIALIDGQMDIARGSIDLNKQRLADLQRRLGSFRPYSANANARRVPDQLTDEVVRTLKERDSLRGSLASREKEKADLRAQFDADISRYKELTARPSGR
ncbi:MAG TPA: DUF4124 domain-containing protein [Steroidobacteraceae bacterium]|nr:DUF4124 domain-containing protein [Steroidobacteraceae bacterium]